MTTVLRSIVEPFPWVVSVLVVCLCIISGQITQRNRELNEANLVIHQLRNVLHELTTPLEALALEIEKTKRDLLGLKLEVLQAQERYEALERFIELQAKELNFVFLLRIRACESGSTMVQTQALMNTPAEF